MASSKPLPVGLQRMIECSVCLEIYQLPSKVPKNLCCGHTFCSECLGKLIESKRIKCSKCRQDTSLTQGYVHKLVTNYAILDLLESSCEVCRNQHWVKRCSHCEKNVCEACHEAHSSQSDVLTEVKKRISVMNDMCEKDTFLQDSKRHTEQAEHEVRQHWDDIIQEATDRKQEDLQKIRHSYNNICKEYIKWKKGFHIAVAKAMSALEESFIDVEAVHTLKEQTERLFIDLECQLKNQPDKMAYKIDQPHTAFQSFLTNGIVTIIPLATSILLPQYNKSTSSLTYGHEGSGPGQFDWPVGVASCPATGNIVISDWQNHRIHILTRSLQPISVSGSHGSGAGQYRHPWGVAISPNTNHIFVADQSNHRIQVSDSQGRPLYRFGSKGSDSDQFDHPLGIAIDQSDLIYICDRYNYRIKVTQADGHLVMTFGSNGSGPNQFSSEPWFIAVSQNNKLVVSDSDGNLYILTCQGQYIRTIKRGQPGKFMEGKGVTMDTHGNIIVADEAGCLFVLKDDGQVVSKIGSPGSGRGQLTLPRGVTLTAEGDIVACDSRNHRVQLFKVPMNAN